MNVVHLRAALASVQDEARRVYGRSDPGLHADLLVLCGEIVDAAAQLNDEVSRLRAEVQDLKRQLPGHRPLVGASMGAG